MHTSLKIHSLACFDIVLHAYARKLHAHMPLVNHLQQAQEIHRSRVIQPSKNEYKVKERHIGFQTRSEKVNVRHISFHKTWNLRASAIGRSITYHTFFSFGCNMEPSENYEPQLVADPSHITFVFFGYDMKRHFHHISQSFPSGVIWSLRK